MRNNEPPRVPMPAGPASFVADDIAMHAAAMTGRLGRRFSMDVAEEALRDMGPMALTHVVKSLAEIVVQRHSHDIERVVHSYIDDRKWAEPIIRDAIYRAVQQFVRETFSALPPTDGGETHG
jgi:hypothetical protein